MSRPSPPPEGEPAGSEHRTLRLGPLRLHLRHLGEELAAALDEAWRPFLVPLEPGPGDLDLALSADPREYFIPPPTPPADNVVRLEWRDGRIGYRGHRLAGWIDPGAGEARARLARGAYETARGAVENFVRAALAWAAAVRGGALVHAAGLEHRGRGYLFYGASGAGKSTLAASSRRGRVLSDDLVLVLPGRGGRLHLVGSPFRGTYTAGPPVEGSFPLAAGFRLIQDTEPRVVQVPRARAVAELVANLPFVAEFFARSPERFLSVERAFADVPLAHLRFAPDDRFWDAIREAGL